MNSALAAKVHTRDDHTCVKCGHHRNLETHHIVPIHMGGTNTEGNLITLCHSCHKFAPDDPLDLLKYCSKHLPPDFEKAKNLVEILITILSHKYPGLLADRTPKGQKKLTEVLDTITRDLWAVTCSGEMDEFVKFMAKYQWKYEEQD